MRWTIHGERVVYSSHWLDFRLADVELPTGRRFDYEVVRSPAPSVGVVVTDDADRVLMLWRHRFIPDRWGWEIPAGRMEAGETPAEAGRERCSRRPDGKPDRSSICTATNRAPG